jgi:hypothetical protein
LTFKGGCDTNAENSPYFHFNEITYIYREESFMEAFEADIGAFKDHQAAIAPAQLQAKAPGQLAEKPRVVPPSIIGYFQRLAEMDDTAGIGRIRRCYWRGIDVRRREGTPPVSGAVWARLGAG